MGSETVAAAVAIFMTRLLSFRFQISESLDNVLKAGHVLTQYQPVPERLIVSRNPRLHRHDVPGHVRFRRIVDFVNCHRNLTQDLKENKFETKPF